MALGTITKRITSITAARSVSIVSALLVSMVLARIISVQDLGQYKTLWILYGVLGPIVTSSLTGLLYYRGTKEHDISRAITSAILWAFVFGVFMMSISWAGFRVWEHLFHAQGLYQAFVYFSIYLFFSGLTSPIEAVFVLKKRNKWLFAHNLISNSIEFTSVVLPYYLGFGIETVAMCLIIAPVLRTLFMIFLVKDDLMQVNFVAVRKTLKTDGAYMGGLVIVALAGIVTVQLDSWFVRWFYDDNALFAEYVMGARKIPFLSAFLSSVSAALLLHIGKSVKERKFEQVFRFIQPLAGLLWSFIVPFLMVFLLFSEEIMLLLFGGFKASAPIFSIYIGTVIVHFVFADTILLAMGKQTRVIQASVIEIVTNVVLSISFLYWIGFSGPAWATLVSHVVYIFMCMYFLRLETGISVKVKDLISAQKSKSGWMIAIIILLTYSLISSFFDRSLLMFFIFSMAVSTLQLVLFRKDIQQVIRQLKPKTMVSEVE